MARSAVREVPLSGKASPKIALSAWRGQSGRRYVVALYTLDQAVEVSAPDAVFIGVRRVDGVARIVGVGHRGSVVDAIALARADGANELHVHRLEDDRAARDAIVEDLIGDDAI